MMLCISVKKRIEKGWRKIIMLLWKDLLLKVGIELCQAAKSNYLMVDNENIVYFKYCRI